MAYVTGQANDLASLRTAIINACTANGWVLNTDVLSKAGVFVRITISGTNLLFLGGLGIDISDQLTNPGPYAPMIGNFNQALTYPVTYEVHILTNPDEVYVVINYNVDFYQWAAWGQSNVAGLPGAGVWYAASKGRPSGAPITLPNDDLGSEKPVLWVWIDTVVNFDGEYQNCFVHHGFDGLTWNPVNVTSGQPGEEQPNAWLSAEPLQLIQPNAWNDEAVLVPIQVWMPRTSGDKVSLAVDHRHARYLRVDFYGGGDIITIGPDKWKVYPWYRKDTAQRDGGQVVEHTGTFGWAVRYTGP